MNDYPAGDEKMLRLIERAVEQGQSVDDPLINQLAQMQPKADRSFQRGLEQILMGQLDAQVRVDRERSRQRRTLWFLRQSRTLLASAAVLVLLGALVFGLMLQRPSSPALAAVTPIEPASPVVVAARNIAAGTTITGDMLAVVTLSELDRQALRQSAPDREFIGDPQAVIGQKAATAMSWFQPIEPGQLGDLIEPCQSASCLPTGLYQIGVPLPADGALGLAPGDRVDVLAFTDDAVRVIASNVFLMELTDDWAMLAAPAWQQGVLMPWSNADHSVALRLHVGPEQPERDATPVEYTFIASEALPEDYRFDLIVSLPVDRGYQLMELPAPIDVVQFTMNGNTLQFWFTDLDVVSIVRGTAVTIRLAKSDAENLDFLIDLGARLTFQPNANQNSRP
ncbi:MAG: SAF domain-containing protein [Anaerolineae bacterium]